jgi:predicted RNA-binding Zn-ribbon protein involved in translation (DUF1610 family)
MDHANMSSTWQSSQNATLYCTNCEHTSPVNGSWVIHVESDYLTYECPNCAATINSRDDRDALTTQSEGSLQ